MLNKISRFGFITLAGAAITSLAIPLSHTLSNKTPKLQHNMYGLIGKITARSGHRDTLIDILLSAVTGLPGCLSYIVSKDSKDEDVIWVTEVWESEESHLASLSIPEVREAITEGRPLIADFGEQIKILPIGGHGLILSDHL